MPNPKTGTVTDDTAKAVREVMAGRIDYKIDKNANIAGPVGRASFEADKLIENARAFIDSIVKAKPPAAKGNYIRNITLSVAMCPGIPLEPATWSAR
jgi:large subunit ribosomal protein L1